MCLMDPYPLNLTLAFLLTHSLTHLLTYLCYFYVYKTETEKAQRSRCPCKTSSDQSKFTTTRVKNRVVKIFHTT